MIRLLLPALATAAAVLVELVFPNQPVGHAGWFCVLIAALVAVTIASGRRVAARAEFANRRAAIVAIALGASAMGVAGVANGLFAPDPRSFVGAPGERLRVDDFGTLTFPNSANAATRYAANFELRTSAHTVVVVEAHDTRGNHLTITQPMGRAFLSPVLLMDQRQRIAGMDLPFDSFNVPAARRVVKAILFAPAQVAQLSRAAGALGDYAVLFAVDDENDRPLRNAIALAPAGMPVRVGGMQLRADVTEYPSVDVVAIPNLFAVGIGALLFVIGALATLRRTSAPRDDRAHVAHDDAALR